MDNWNGSDLATLAPAVDEDAALVLFRRRRSRRRFRRRAGAVVFVAIFVTVGAFGAAAVLDRDGGTKVVALDEPPDVEQARAEIVAAFQHAHDGSLTIEERDTAVDDPSGLAAIAHEISDEFGSDADLVRADNIDVVFTSATSADVGYTIVATGAIVRDNGEAVLTGAGWKMTRDTRCREFAPAGKTCP
jgi:hypothetical protein